MFLQYIYIGEKTYEFLIPQMSLPVFFSNGYIFAQKRPPFQPSIFLFRYTGETETDTKAVEKHFNSVLEDQKQDYLDFLFDRDVVAWFDCWHLCNNIWLFVG